MKLKCHCCDEPCQIDYIFITVSIHYTETFLSNRKSTCEHDRSSGSNRPNTVGRNSPKFAVFLCRGGSRDTWPQLWLSGNAPTLVRLKCSIYYKISWIFPPCSLLYRHQNAPNWFCTGAAPHTTLGELTTLPRPTSRMGRGYPPSPHSSPSTSLASRTRLPPTYFFVPARLILRRQFESLSYIVTCKHALSTVSYHEMNTRSQSKKNSMLLLLAKKKK